MKRKKAKSRVHPDLDKLDLSVSSFGEIERTLAIDEINSFLNKNVDDKKLAKK